jgi:hypothetical protein
MHQPSDVVAMVPDVKLAPDDLGDPRRSPQLRRIPRRERPGKKDPQQDRAACSANLGRPAG